MSCKPQMNCFISYMKHLFKLIFTIYQFKPTKNALYISDSLLFCHKAAFYCQHTLYKAGVYYINHSHILSTVKLQFNGLLSWLASFSLSPLTRAGVVSVHSTQPRDISQRDCRKKKSISPSGPFGFINLRVRINCIIHLLPRGILEGH